MRPQSRRICGVVGFLALFFVGCSADSSRISEVSAGIVLQSQVVPSVLESLTPGGKYILQGPRPEKYEQISADEAGSMGLAAAKLFGPNITGWLEKTRGGPVDLSRLDLISVYYAATPYDPVPEGYHPGMRKNLGPYYLVTLGDRGTPTLSVAVSAYNTDFRFDNNRMVRAPLVHGNDFFFVGIPRSSKGQIVTPEAATATIAERMGARVASVPRLVLAPKPFSPQTARWKIELDRPVNLGSGIVGREVYIRYLGGKLEAPRETQPLMKAVHDPGIPTGPELKQRRVLPPTSVRIRADIPTEFREIQ
jgi:hypothetical protein